MLVILSDLHLTDGSTGTSVSPGAFHLLAERLSDLAIRASSRADGSYRPIERIDLVLLGDVLDFIRSARWIQQAARPWDNVMGPELIDTVTRIAGDVLRHNSESLAILRWIAAEGAVRVPPANHLRQGAAAADGQPVPVHIHYMVGGDDWFLHLPGRPYDALRKSVVQHLGLANPAEQPFPHDPRESDVLLDVLRRHKTFARHGDIFDPIHFEEDRDSSSLGDAIVIELLIRFANIVETELAADLPPETLLGMREIDNIRPLLLVPVWIDGLLERTCPLPAVRKQVKKVWDDLVDQFLDLPMVRTRNSWSPIDLADGLQRALKFNRRLAVGWASATTQWLSQLHGGKPNSYSRHALAEQDFRNRRAKHIVYGHTHLSESVPLDASFAEGYVLNQVYFNAGTWRRVHRQTESALGEHEFIASDTLSYLAFFQGDERNGRPYETWTGTLAVQPSEANIYRIDQGVGSHLLGQGISPPGLQGHRPHFSARPVRGPVVPTRRM